MLETKLYTLLSGSTLITTLTTRIYPVVMPQEPTFPCITYQRVSGNQQNSLAGYATLENPRIQIDVWSESYSGAKTLAGNIHTVMDGATAFKATLISDDDDYQSEIPLYRVSMDFSCWNKE